MRPRGIHKELSPTQRHRMQVVLLARSTLFAVLLVIAYYALPLNNPDASDILVLTIGLTLFAGLIAWQIRAIVVSPFPRLRGYRVPDSYHWNPFAPGRFRRRLLLDWADTNQQL